MTESTVTKKIVKLSVEDRYTFPPMCCACGNEIGNNPGVNVYGQNLGSTIRLTFPLCDVCWASSRTTNGAARKGAWIGFGIGVLITILLFIMTQDPNMIGMGFILAIIAALVGRVISNQQWKKGQDTELLKKLSTISSNVSTCVRIRKYQPPILMSKGSIELAFTNTKFADAFEQLNS